MLATPAPAANAQRPSPCVLATDPSRNTVSRYTCGFSQVRARHVSTAVASVMVAGRASVAVGAADAPGPADAAGVPARASAVPEASVASDASPPARSASPLG